MQIDAIYTDGPMLQSRAEAADAIVLVVGQISHPAAAKVRLVARRFRKPLASATGPSLSRVRAAIALAHAAIRARHETHVETSSEMRRRALGTPRRDPLLCGA